MRVDIRSLDDSSQRVRLGGFTPKGRVAKKEKKRTRKLDKLHIFVPDGYRTPTFDSRGKDRELHSVGGNEREDYCCSGALHIRPKNVVLKKSYGHKIFIAYK